MRFRKNRPGNGGFTLVEILVALTVLILMIAMLTQVVSFAQEGVGNLGNSALRRQDAATVLAHMSRELSASLRPSGINFEGSQAGARQFQLIINPPGVPAAKMDSIFWSTSVSSQAGGSSLIGYFIRWETVPGKPPQPLLCRMFLDSAQAQAPLTELQSTETMWANTDLIDANAQATIQTGYQGWLADNIIGLYARALDPEMKPIVNAAQSITGVSDPSNYRYPCWQVNFGPAGGQSYVNQPTIAQFDSSLGYQYTRASDGAVINRYGPALPGAIELVLIAANPKDINQLAAPPTQYSSGDPSAMWSDIQQYMGNLPPSLKKSARIYSTIVTQ